MCKCGVPLQPESIAFAQLAEKASQCDEPENLEVQADLLGPNF
ncbi:hypothetical protein SynROS8604_02016 [Synechococcus sp. ROS8604]|nr:hypothetical protein SynROS8604_02016 [Synechococcus sp. ROS8604]